jgi:peptidyl-prolyl cis-trans isomerase B (cyclophilin B)
MAKNKKKKPAPKKTPWYRTKGFYAAAAVIVVAVVAAALIFGGKAEEETPIVSDYTAEIVIRDYGTITLDLYGSAAPITVQNFVKLAQSGFYDGLTFHRIMEGFMMQGGCPEGTGFGGSDEKIFGEFYANGFMNMLSHTRGAISMARSNPFNSASSQFFIVHEDSTFLDGGYAVFGYVTEGLDVVDAVCNAAQPIDGNGSIARDAQPVILSVKIRTE